MTIRLLWLGLSWLCVAIDAAAFTSGCGTVVVVLLVVVLVVAVIVQVVVGAVWMLFSQHCIRPSHWLVDFLTTESNSQKLAIFSAISSRIVVQMM